MKKNFENPSIKISVFSRVSLITTSGIETAVGKARDYINSNSAVTVKEVIELK